MVEVGNEAQSVACSPMVDEDMPPMVGRGSIPSGICTRVGREAGTLPWYVHYLPPWVYQPTRLPPRLHAGQCA